MPLDSQQMFVGRLNGNAAQSRMEARGLVGHLDELAIFPRALSEAEILRLAKPWTKNEDPNPSIHGFFKEEHGAAYKPMPLGESSPIYYTDDRKALTAFLDGHVEAVSPPMQAWNFN
jgi:hypothetical protein